MVTQRCNSTMPIKLTILWPLIGFEIQMPESWILYNYYVMEISRLVSTRIKLVTCREIIILPCRKHLGVLHWVVLHMPLAVLMRSPSANDKFTPCLTCLMQLRYLRLNPAEGPYCFLDMNTWFHWSLFRVLGVSMWGWQVWDTWEEVFGFQEQQLEASCHYIGYRYP